MKFICKRNGKTGAFAKNEVLCKGVKSLGKEGSARGEEPLFKAVFFSRKKKRAVPHGNETALQDASSSQKKTYAFFIACSTATATSTDAPTIGLLPIPIRPIISTWAGTEEEPAN